MKTHQTATKVIKDSSIVLKRGMPFFFDISLFRDFDPTTDAVKVEFERGKYTQFIMTIENRKFSPLYI